MSDNDARTPEWKATAGNLPAAAPILAGLMVTLKAECEAQHARAEAAESRIAALEAERDAWKCNYEQAANNRARWINHSEAYEATLATVTQERDEARARWQPIATAPKDADVLLLYLDGSGVLPGYWEGKRWLACETSGLTGGGWHTEPTHWMPLPDPPSVLSGPVSDSGIGDAVSGLSSSQLDNAFAGKDLEALKATLATVAQALEGLEKEWRAAAIVDESLPAWACADEVEAVRALIPPGKEPT